MATLQIELEDSAGTSWWAGALATLASQSGSAYTGRPAGNGTNHGHRPPSAVAAAG